MVGNRGIFDTVDVLGTGLSSKDTQDSSSAADIEHNLVLEDMGIVHNGVFVGKGSSL